MEKRISRRERGRRDKEEEEGGKGDLTENAMLVHRKEGKKRICRCKFRMKRKRGK